MRSSLIAWLLSVAVVFGVAQVPVVIAPVQSGTIRTFHPNGAVISEFGVGQNHPTAIVLGDLPNTIFVADDGNMTISVYDYVSGVKLSSRPMPFKPSFLSPMRNGNLLAFDRDRQVGYEYNYHVDVIVTSFIVPSGYELTGLAATPDKVVGVSANQGARIMAWQLSGGLPYYIGPSAEPANYFGGVPMRDGNLIYTVLRDQHGPGGAHPRRFFADTLTWDSGFSGDTPFWRYCFQYVPTSFGSAFGLIHEPSGGFGTTIGIFNPVNGVLTNWFPPSAPYGMMAVSPSADGSVSPTTAQWTFGTNTSASGNSTTFSDDFYAHAGPSYSGSRANPHAQLITEGISDRASSNSASMTVETGATTSLVMATLEVWDYVSNAYVQIDTWTLAEADQSRSTPLPGDGNRYFAGGNLKARISFNGLPIAPRAWTARVDRVSWNLE